MNATSLTRLAVLVVSLATLAGCATYPDGSVGRARFEGNAAYIDGQPFKNGAYLFPHQKVSTGARSTLTVIFRKGGTMQLDENTDPVIESVWQQISQGACTVVAIAFGRVFLDANNICVVTPQLAGLGRSKLAISVGQGVTEVTVVEGSFAVSRPRQVLVTQKQRFTVDGGRQQVQSLSDADVAESTAWRKKFDVPLDAALQKLINDREALKNPETRGWCCIQREFGQTTKGACDQRKGKFFLVRADAAQECRAKP